MDESFPADVAAKLYKSYARPDFEYASAVWHSSLRDRNAFNMERLQAVVARSFLRSEWTTPKSELLSQLELRVLRWQREIISSMTFFHHLLTQPPSLSTCLHPFAHTRSSRSFLKPYQLLSLTLSFPASLSHFSSTRHFCGILFHTLYSASKSTKQFKSAKEMH